MAAGEFHGELRIGFGCAIPRTRLRRQAQQAKKSLTFSGSLHAPFKTYANQLPFSKVLGWFGEKSAKESLPKKNTL
jgi:hypothetical protein